MLLRLAAIVLLVGLLVGTDVEPAVACSCDPPTVSEAFDWATVVFTGRLVSIEGDFPATLTFEVSRVWKGTVTGTQVVMTSSLGAGDCGYPFRDEGQDYLVYAESEGDRGGLWVWLCAGTTVLEHAQDDLDILGEGWLPGQEPVDPETEAGDGLEGQPPAIGDTGTGLASGRCLQREWGAGLLAATGVVLAALAFATRRRARQS